MFGNFYMLWSGLKGQKIIALLCFEKWAPRDYKTRQFKSTLFTCFTNTSLANNPTLLHTTYWF